MSAASNNGCLPLGQCVDRRNNDLYLVSNNQMENEFMDGDDCDSIQDYVLLYRSTFALDTKLSHVARIGVCVRLGVQKTKNQGSSTQGVALESYSS